MPEETRRNSERRVEIKEEGKDSLEGEDSPSSQTLPAAPEWEYSPAELEELENAVDNLLNFEEPPAPIPKKSVGKKVSYDRRKAMEICLLIAEGKTLKEICALPRTPARQTFNRWVVNDPALSRAYAAARMLSSHSLEEEALDVARATKRTPGTPQHVRAVDILLTQLRWSAARRNPAQYSERAPVNVSVPIQINTSLDLGDGGMAAATSDHPNIYTLEATTVLPDPPRPDVTERAGKESGRMSSQRTQSTIDKKRKKETRRQKMDRLAAGPDNPLAHGRKGMKQGDGSQQRAAVEKRWAAWRKAKEESAESKPSYTEESDAGKAAQTDARTLKKTERL